MDNTYFRQCVVISKMKSLSAFASLNYSSEGNYGTNIKKMKLFSTKFGTLSSSRTQLFRNLLSGTKHVILVYGRYMC